jgi:NADH:ubiquinone oxidoreductase subunit 6 (subunit J)
MSQNMILDSTIFWVFATLSVLAALGVVLHRSIIYAALFLIVVFMSIAGIFVLNNADFLAIAQTIVYGVGLTIVMIFGVMFTGDRLFKDGAVPRSQYLAYTFIALLSFGVLLSGVLTLFQGREQFLYPQWQVAPSAATINILQTQGSTPMLGALLFQKYLLPFEVASILLLVAMVGAIVLAKKRFTSEEEVLGLTKFDLNTESDLNPEAETLLETKFNPPLSIADAAPGGVAGTSTDKPDDIEDETAQMAGVK